MGGTQVRPAQASGDTGGRLKPLDDQFPDELETEAREWIAELKAYRAYQGSDRRYADKAKGGMSVISTVGRLRASEASRMAIELATERVLPGRRLTSGE